MLGSIAQALKVGGCKSFSAGTAGKFDAPVLANFGGTANEDHADLAEAFDMRATARLEIRGLNFNGAKYALAIDIFANAELGQLVGGAIADGDKAIFEDCFVGSALGSLENFGRGPWAAEIDGAEFGAKMEGNGGKAEAFLKHGGEEMLSGVLLHVIEATRPLDTTFDWAGGEFLVDDVDDVVTLIADVENVGCPEEADVVRLAAGSGIEGGLVEDDFPGGNGAAGARDGGPGFAGEDAGFEVLEVGIVVIESMSGHGVRGNFSMGILGDVRGCGDVVWDEIEILWTGWLPTLQVDEMRIFGDLGLLDTLDGWACV